MKIENIEDFSKINGKIEIQHISINKTTKDSIVELFSSYNGRRFKNNYSSDSIEKLISTDRFKDGLLCLKINDLPIVCFFMDVYKNWGVISRLIIWKYFNVPLTSAFLLPVMEKISMNNNRDGVFFSFNAQNKGMYDRLKNKKDIWKIDVNDNKYDIYIKSIKNMEKYELLPCPVIYNYVEQYIVYKSFSGDSHPVF